MRGAVGVAAAVDWGGEFDVGWEGGLKDGGGEVGIVPFGVGAGGVVVLGKGDEGHWGGGGVRDVMESLTGEACPGTIAG